MTEKILLDKDVVKLVSVITLESTPSMFGAEDKYKTFRNTLLLMVVDDLERALSRISADDGAEFKTCCMERKLNVLQIDTESDRDALILRLGLIHHAHINKLIFADNSLKNRTFPLNDCFVNCTIDELIVPEKYKDKIHNSNPRNDIKEVKYV